MEYFMNIRKKSLGKIELLYMLVIACFALFSISSCTRSIIPPPPQIPKIPKLVASTTGHDFGNIKTRGFDEKVFLIKNTGDGILKIGNVSVKGEEFYIQSDDCSGQEIEADSTCRINVTFSPNSEGKFSGELIVPSNDPEKHTRPLSVPLKGQVRIPSVFPDIEADQALLSFGSVDIGANSGQTINMLNQGRGILKIQNATVSDRHFIIKEDNCSGKNIPPSSSCGMRIQFVPEGCGDLSGKLRIKSNDPDETTLNIPLKGKGLCPPNIDANLEQSFIGFVDIGSSSTKSIDISNAGKGILKIHKVSVKDRYFYKREDGCSGKSLLSGDSCNVKIEFIPDKLGNLSGDLCIESNDPDENEFFIPLNGIGTGGCRFTEYLGEFTLDNMQTKKRRKRGKMKPGECKLYSILVEERGDFEICIPGGYDIRGNVVESPIKEDYKNCTFEDESTIYKRYIRLGVKKGTKLAVNIIRSTPNSPDDFTFYFVLDLPVR